MIYALWVIIYDSYLWSCFIMRIWWWWKMDDSYGLKERLWVILSLLVKSPEFRFFQFRNSVRIFAGERRYPRTADLVVICKVGWRDPRTVDLGKIFTGESRDPRTAESVRIFKRGSKDPWTVEMRACRDLEGNADWDYRTGPNLCIPLQKFGPNR